ncbi:MAG: hypothetical protein WEA24_04115 [Gemmatimonadota bacterium]
MSHLTLETLARLVDEQPAETEAAHLRGCAHCSAELEELHGTTTALGVLPEPALPEHAWPALERRLLDEGLLGGGRGARRWPAALLRLAAALVVFLAGAASSVLLLDGSQPARLATTDTPEATFAPAASPPEDAAPDASATPAAVDPMDATPRPGSAAAENAARLAAIQEESRSAAAGNAAGRAGPRAAPAGAGPQRYASFEPRSVEEAEAWLRLAEQNYVSALTLYAELAGEPRTGDAMSRLAALEAITRTTGAALDWAPADPVINGYHLSAVAERDATLRQIAATATNSWF